jgi:uncharacterized protein YjbI with pentapeptide repeats
MSGGCAYYFDENDASTWGPDAESAAYWQERYEELVGSVERERDELAVQVADGMEDGGEELEPKLEQKEQLLEERREEFPLLGDDVLTDGRWVCPHKTVEGSDRCIFHQPLSDKPVDSDAETVALLDAIERATNERDSNYTRFIGANIREIELTPDDYLNRGGESLDESLPTQAIFDFRYASINTAFTLNGDSVGMFNLAQPIFLSIICRGRVSTESTRFLQPFSMLASDFTHGSCSFIRTTFQAKAIFDFTRFHETGDFGGSKFRDLGSGSFKQAEFTGDRSGRFTDAEFTGDWSGNFADTEFSGDNSGLFFNTEFTGIRSGDFADTEFSGDSSGLFENADFTGDSSGNFADTEFTGDRSGIYHYAEFTGDHSSDFLRAEFTGQASGAFINTEFTGDRSGRFPDTEFTGDHSGKFAVAEFTGDYSGDFENAEFTGDHSGIFENAEFTGDHSGIFENAEFIGDGSGRFSKASFQVPSAGFFAGANAAWFALKSSASFSGARFAEADFSNTTFGLESKQNDEVNEGARVSDEGAESSRDTQEEAERLDESLDRSDNKQKLFATAVSFENATFGVANFDGTTFHRPVTFDNARFNSESSFNAAFEDTVTFDGTIFDDNVRRVALPALDGKTHSFAGVEFRFRADLSECISLAGSTFEGAILHRVNLTGVDLSGTNLSGADLTGSVLDGVSLCDAKLENTVLDSVHTDEATFRRTFEEAPNEIGGDSTTTSDWSRYTCRYDPKRSDDGTAHSADLRADGRGRSRSEAYVKRAYQSATVYQKLEQVARYNALSGPQGKLFLARKNVERLRYYHQMQMDVPLRQRAHALSLWLRSWAAKLVLNYGESPWRVIATSAFIVASCALLYPLGFVRPGDGPPLSYGPTSSTWVPALFDSLYVSLLTFATADLGQFQPVGYGRLLVTAEATAGLVLFALLIFVFGRRAAR